MSLAHFSDDELAARLENNPDDQEAVSEAAKRFVDLVLTIQELELVKA